MWIGDLDPWKMRCLLVGFGTGLSVAGFSLVDAPSWIEVGARRGWRERAVGPISEMRERGMSEREIVTELIEIEIDVLRETQKSLCIAAET